MNDNLVLIKSTAATAAYTPSLGYHEFSTFPTYPHYPTNYTPEPTNYSYIDRDQTIEVRPTVNRVSVIERDLVIWAIIDGLLLIAILCGNILTILAVRFSRRLRAVISNHFVLSLAISDLLVGLTLPYHLAFYLGLGLGSNKNFCLLRFFFVIVACTVSIWNIIAIALDRYIAICYPLHYGRYITRRVALVVMAAGWCVGLLIASIPVIFNRWDSATECEFDEIFHSWYLAGVITPIFSFVWFGMLFVYWRIWREASKHVKQLRISGGDGPSDWKSVQVVLLILGCFTICWLPYFIVACAQIFNIMLNSSPVIYKAAFSLAMSNSAMNPIIYSWKNSGFRRAFVRLLRCKSPDTIEPSQSMRSNLHRKSSSVHHQDQISGAFHNFSTPPFMQRKVDPIHSMGITIEEDEDTIGIDSRIPTNELNTSNGFTNKVKDPISRPTSYKSSSSPSPSLKKDKINFQADINLPQTSPTKPTINGSITIKTGNLTINLLNDENATKNIFKENFLNVPGATSETVISKRSRFKSRSANSIEITSHSASGFQHNGSNTNGDTSPAKQNIEYVVSEKNNRKFLPNFSFSKSQNSNSFSGVNTILDPKSNFPTFGETTIVCKIVDRN